MPQTWLVVQCYQCKAFQVDQEKKAKKWQCKMCGEKQSLQRLYARSHSAKDCRLVVQQYNQARGKVEEEEEDRALAAAYADDGGCGGEGWEGQADEAEQQPAQPPAQPQRWRAYQEEEEEGDEGWTVALPERPTAGKQRRGGSGQASSSHAKRQRQQQQEEEGVVGPDYGPEDGWPIMRQPQQPKQPKQWPVHQQHWAQPLSQQNGRMQRPAQAPGWPTQPPPLQQQPLALDGSSAPWRPQAEGGVAPRTQEQQQQQGWQPAQQPTQQRAEPKAVWQQAQQGQPQWQEGKAQAQPAQQPASQWGSGSNATAAQQPWRQQQSQHQQQQPPLGSAAAAAAAGSKPKWGSYVDAEDDW